MFEKGVLLAAAVTLIVMARVLWRDYQELQKLKLRESLLPRPKKGPRVTLPDSEDTRLAIAAAKRAKAEFDRIEQLHDNLAKQRYGSY